MSLVNIFTQHSKYNFPHNIIANYLIKFLFINKVIKCEALYIIITELLYTLKRDDMQKKSEKIALFDDMHASKLRDDIPLLRNG